MEWGHLILFPLRKDLSEKGRFSFKRGCIHHRGTLPFSQSSGLQSTPRLPPRSCLYDKKEPPHPFPAATTDNMSMHLCQLLLHSTHFTVDLSLMIKLEQIADPAFSLTVSKKHPANSPQPKKSHLLVSLLLQVHGERQPDHVLSSFTIPPAWCLDILKDLFIIIVCVWIFHLHVCKCITCVPGTCRGQRLP